MREGASERSGVAEDLISIEGEGGGRWGCLMLLLLGLRRVFGSACVWWLMGVICVSAWVLPVFFCFFLGGVHGVGGLGDFGVEDRW